MEIPPDNKYLRLLIESTYQNLHSEIEDKKGFGHWNTVGTTLSFLKTATPTELKEIMVDSDGATSDEEDIPRTLETTGFDDDDDFEVKLPKKKRLTRGRRPISSSKNLSSDEETEKPPAPPTKGKGKALKRKLILSDHSENA